MNLIEKMGEPDRIEPSGYGYDWWVYLDDITLYGGRNRDGKVNQVYTADTVIGCLAI